MQDPGQPAATKIRPKREALTLKIKPSELMWGEWG
jgi:hypothetical protein